MKQLEGSNLTTKEIAAKLLQFIIGESDVEGRCSMDKVSRFFNGNPKLLPACRLLQDNGYIQSTPEVVVFIKTTDKVAG